MLVFWSRDPDGTQHNQGDSLNTLVPGINGPTSLAGIKNSDDDLGKIRQALADLGIDKTTDVIVTADHGFSVISKESATSTSAKAIYADVPEGFVPPGVVAIDIAAGVGLPLWDPDSRLGAHHRRHVIRNSGMASSEKIRTGLRSWSPPTGARTSSTSRTRRSRARAQGGRRPDGARLCERALRR